MEADSVGKIRACTTSHPKESADDAHIPGTFGGHGTMLAPTYIRAIIEARTPRYGSAGGGAGGVYVCSYSGRVCMYVCMYVCAYVDVGTGPEAV